MRQPLLHAEWAIFARYLSRSSRPILVGPWRSEVGFELLYWIPFLTSFAKRYGIPKDRLIAIGRGGSACWYESAGKADLPVLGRPRIAPLAGSVSVASAADGGSVDSL
jgi:hypothetical protein